MALLFNADNERVTHSAASSINNLDTQTWITITYPNQVDQQNKRLFRKTQLDVSIGNTGGLDGTVVYYRARATTDTVCRCAASTITTGSWQFIAMTDGDGVTPQMWHGAYPSRAVEVSYNAQTTGSGAPTDESAVDLDVGARTGTNRHIDGRIAMVWVYNVVLTEAQILAHQYQPSMILSGCVLKSIYGYNGTGTQPDYSGNGNSGAVTGATVADHVPLPPPFGFKEEVPYAVAVAAAGLPAGSLSLMGVGI